MTRFCREAGEMPNWLFTRDNTHMSTVAQWNKYAVGTPSTRPNWTNADCQPLESVHHICHVTDAFRMLEDGKIRSSLIWDESRLNNTRTCVSWLSPNSWTNGSLYGNVEFHFEWRAMIKNKNFFWVEGMDGYRPPAFRILITDKRQVADLTPYEVGGGDGPLFFDRTSKQWFWNGELTGEFMFDEDLSLERSTGIGFCNHNEQICRKDGSACEDHKLRGNEAGLRLISKAVAQGVIRPSNVQLFMDGNNLNQNSDRSVLDILYRLAKLPTGGSVEEGDAAALPLATAILHRLGRGQKAAPLATLFKSTSELELAVRKRMAKAFEMELQGFPSTEDEL
jgi:hypothetical protein